MTEERWLRLMSSWEFEPSSDTFQDLIRAYGQPHRHYHTAEHITACLRHFDRCQHALEHPREVETALWFHDAIYQPLASDNEKRSAQWAGEFLQSQGADEKSVNRVYDLIIATADHRADATDASLLIDIDLAILGANAEDYDVFEKNVRKEYAMVPLPQYREKRAEVLEGFLRRNAIFLNEPFVSELEQRARANLKCAIGYLTNGRTGDGK